MNFGLQRVLTISLKKQTKKVSSFLVYKHLSVVFSSSCLKNEQFKKEVEHTASLQLYRRSLGKNTSALQELTEGKRNYETVNVGALKVSGNRTNTAINENVFGFNCQTS